MPTTASTPYSGPVAVTRTTTIKAIAAGGNYSASTVATGSYNIVAVAPTFSPAGGTYSTAKSVTLSTTSPGANIYYTTDGSMPTTSSTPYTGPITVSASTTIKAIAAGGNYAASTVGVATYTITP